jgi:class 3 adenylate cyclase
VTLFRVKRDEIMGIIANSPNCWHPRLSGKLLLNNQTFRDVFGMDRLRSTLQLKMRSLTILFTDLKGSTAIYDRVGDLVAYSLVRDHFAVLRDAVREHSGAIVKTMGDSLMATFSSPDDGVAAALAMMSGVACLGERWQRDGLELGLKIGLHEGPALVINADERLDYFGQAVNIAARVQGLAAAGEVWLTAAIFGYEAVRRQLEARHLEPRPLTAALKGVGDPVAVYCCQVAAPRGQPVPTR